MKDKNLKVKILIGVTASGKSIWASEFALRNEKWIRVNRDDLRMMLKTQNFCDPKVESLINDIQDEIILNSLAKNLNVIVDNTNLKQSRIKQIIKLVENKADIEFQVFDISLDKAIELAQQKLISGICTNPVDKSLINSYLQDISIKNSKFIGHTEYIRLGFDNDVPVCICE